MLVDRSERGGISLNNFFTWFVDLVTSLVSFVFQLIEGLLRLIGLIPTAVSVLTNSIGYLPSILAAFAAATITICVIFVIVGRDEGGQK